MDKIQAADIPDQDLDRVLSELESLSIQTPADYVPHPKQLLFHTSPAKIRFMSGGNQSGKTEGGCAEDVMHATGIYPDWFPMDLRLKGPNKGRVTVTDYGAGAAVFEEKLWHWLPKDLVVDVQRTVKGSVQKIHIRHISGGISQIEVMTHEQADNAFEGWTGHWAHFDEPPPREKFVATLRGLIALHGRCWLTLTPISEPWLYDEFISKEDSDVYFITVDILDNPHLSREYIQWFESKLTEDEKEARLHGHFRHLSGLVYKMFDPAVHIIPANTLQIDPGWPTYFVCDPHDRKPHFGIWAKVDPFGTLYVIDEIKHKDTFQGFAKAVLMREAMDPSRFGYPMDVIRILDPNKGNTPSAVSGLKLKDEFANHGLYFTADVNDDITTGHLAVSGRLSWDQRYKLSSTNHPKLYFIKETTRECVRYMQLYTWDDWRGAGKDAKSSKEKPTEKFKDFPDTVRYLVMSNPAFFERDDSDPVHYGSGGTTGYGL